MSTDERMRELARRAASDYEAALELVAAHEDLLAAHESAEARRDAALDRAYDVLKGERDRRAAALLRRARIRRDATRESAIAALEDAAARVGPGCVTDLHSAAETVLGSDEVDVFDGYGEPRIDAASLGAFVAFARNMLAERALELSTPEFRRRHPGIVFEDGTEEAEEAADETDLCDTCLEPGCTGECREEEDDDEGGTPRPARRRRT